MERKNTEFKILIGYTKEGRYGTREKVYLEGFKWDCGWYWGGGYIGNSRFHCHFDGCFLDAPDSRGHPLGSFYDPWTKPPDYVKEENFTRIENGASVWEPLSTFLDDPKFTAGQWWRIKDLYKQFYIYTKAAEAFRHGGHCSSNGRSEGETNPAKADEINDHIQSVIIPEIVKALGVKI